MKYEFLESGIERENIKLPESDKINHCLLKNNSSEIIKAIDFFASEEKFLYIHGFMGTGKKQFVSYISEFLEHSVFKLEYYCTEATVCDDILLDFTSKIDNNAISKAINLNAKITTLNVKFKQQISSIKKPFVIILHTFDNISADNITAVKAILSDIINEPNVKIIVTTRALITDIIEQKSSDKSIFLKALNKNIFKELLTSNSVSASDKQIEDLYEITRGYYFYTVIAIKLLQALNFTVAEFVQKFKNSGQSFDYYLGNTYINTIPAAIKNFFWFLKCIRHGISLNALAILDLYDEFSIEYLKTNFIIFQANDNIYLHDFFAKKVEMVLPTNTEIKLHKYIIGIYEKQIKESLKTRVINLSRQALRAEINYHESKISEIENNGQKNDAKHEPETLNNKEKESEANKKTDENKQSYNIKFQKAQKLYSDKKYTEAIEEYKKIMEDENIGLTNLVECRLQLANVYKKIEDYDNASHYYELVETYYKHHNEQINLNYLYYELTDLYYKMYKNERAIETIKKVIYSVDTPQSLMVNACTLLGNIYSDINNPQDAFSYYKKALDSLDENVTSETLAELYFKFALANDDKEDYSTAFEYYNKCINTKLSPNPYKVLCYSNMASCYYESGNYDDALDCYLKAYKIDKENNNFDGIYYLTSNLAKIYLELDSDEALKYLIEAKKSAEFLNEQYYILESSLALGDYYYNLPDKKDEALKEYFEAKNMSFIIQDESNLTKLEQRIQDMKLRMPKEEFKKISEKYEK